RRGTAARARARPAPGAPPPPPPKEAPGPPPGCPVRPGPPAGEARDPAVGRHAACPGPEQPALHADVDVARFEQPVADGRQEALEQIAGPYRGDLLAGFFTSRGGDLGSSCLDN